MAGSRGRVARPGFAFPDGLPLARGYTLAPTWIILKTQDGFFATGSLGAMASDTPEAHSGIKGNHMKKLEIITRTYKLEQIKSALGKLGISGMTVIRNNFV